MSSEFPEGNGNSESDDSDVQLVGRLSVTATSELQITGRGYQFVQRWSDPSLSIAVRSQSSSGHAQHTLGCSLYWHQ